MAEIQDISYKTINSQIIIIIIKLIINSLSPESHNILHCWLLVVILYNSLLWQLLPLLWNYLWPLAILLDIVFIYMSPCFFYTSYFIVILYIFLYFHYDTDSIKIVKQL